MTLGANGVEITRVTKLRNSCDTCSAAKIKCTQEKPSCTYCVRRSKVCIYGASKRVRRASRAGNTQEAIREKPAPKPTTTSSASTIWASPVSAHPEPLSKPLSALESMAGSDLSTISFLSGLSPNPPPLTQCTQDWPEFLATIESPGIAASPLPTEPAASAAEWTNFGVLEGSFAYPDDATFDFSSSLATSPDPSKKVVRPIMFNKPSTSTISSIFGQSLDTLTKDNLLAATTDGSSEPEFGSSNTEESSPGASTSAGTATPTAPMSPRCDCLSCVFLFLEQLSVEPADVWTCSSIGGGSGGGLPKFDQTCGQIESISARLYKILQCPCSNNGDTLVMLSLIIFKCLAWYAAAVNTIVSDEDGNEAGTDDRDKDNVYDDSATALHPRFMPASSLVDHLDTEEDVEGEDQRRIFIQHILSRLTGLQSLIGRISQRLANASAGSNTSTSTGVGIGFSPTATAQSPYRHKSAIESTICVLPFSSSLVHAFLSDLRERLCTLSQAVAEKLREF